MFSLVQVDVRARESIILLGGDRMTMEENIYCMANEMNKIVRRAYGEYSLSVEALCHEKVSEEELSQFLDYLLDFAFDKHMLDLYKKVCKHYMYIYPECISSYAFFDF